MVKTVEQLDTTGKHTPTAYATGRFLVYDRNGKRVAYGTGPLSKGDVTIASTSESSRAVGWPGSLARYGHDRR